MRTGLKREPEWLDLGGGRVLAKPFIPAVDYNAEARAGREWRRRLGIGPDGEGGEIAADADGLMQVLYWKHVALLTITDWEGPVDGEGKPAPATPENIADLMENDVAFSKAFRNAITLAEARRQVEKNGSGPAPSGTSAAGQPTAGGAETKKPIAPEVSPEPEASYVPT